MIDFLMTTLFLLALVCFEAFAISWLITGRVALLREIKKLRSQMEKPEGK